MKVHHVGIYVHDLEVSEEFYENYFGLKIELRLTILNEHITFMTSELEDIRIELIKAEDGLPVEGTVHLALQIDNLEKSIGLLATRGLYPIEGPLLLENGWKTIFYQGPSLEIIELLEV
jgi:lactoylglutathione lyase